MWQAEAELRQNEEKIKVLAGRLNEAYRTMSLDDPKQKAEIDDMKTSLAKLKEERAAIIAKDKKISDGLPQRERERANVQDFMLKKRLERSR
jgi:hypothetical protein